MRPVVLPRSRTRRALRTLTPAGGAHKEAPDALAALEAVELPAPYSAGISCVSSRRRSGGSRSQMFGSPDACGSAGVNVLPDGAADGLGDADVLFSGAQK